MREDVSICYVHGTGVRRRGYLSSLAHLRAACEGLGLNPASSVGGCYWGELGAKLKGAGESIPRLAALGTEAVESGPVPWSLLSEDPLLELRLSVVANRRAFPGDTFATPVLRKLEQLEVSRARLGDIPVQLVVRAREWLVRQEVVAKYCTLTTDSARVIARKLARSLTGHLVALCEERFLELEESGPPGVEYVEQQVIEEMLACASIVDEEVKTEFTERLTQVLWHGDLSLSRKSVDYGLGMLGVMIARGGLTRQLRNDRPRISQALFPIPGDVLLYQSRGEELRDFVHQGILEQRERARGKKLVVLAHSLGSVIAVEVQFERGLPIDSLVTMGSPIGLLYELDVLPMLRFGEKPGQSLPWINVYDRNDPIAHKCGPFFECRDVEVEMGYSITHSHTSYLRSGSFWRKFAEVL